MRDARRGLVTDVQRFSVHDGPGIRTTVFFKGCPLRCRWCQNPEALRSHVELAFVAQRCRDHGGCFSSCPRQALTRAPERLVRARCDVCSSCVLACPFGAYQVVGREVSLDDLLAEVLRDAPFYEATGGGVTLSGGEPTAQMGFCTAFARGCRGRGLEVGLETCGAFAWDAFVPVLDALDFVLYDLKVIDAGLHRALTGADNRTILDNARKLAAFGAKVTFRMPVVPGGNDGERDLAQLARFLESIEVPRIVLLPLHAMGEGKLERLGFPIEPLGLDRTRIPGSVEAAAARLGALGIEVTT